MSLFIKVNAHVYHEEEKIIQALSGLESHDILSYDCETQSIYDKQDKEEAKTFLEEHESEAERSDISLCKLIENSSGLSFPTLTKITHFIFGTTKESAVVIICQSPEIEQLVLTWLNQYKGKLLIHNSLFDLKLVYHRTKQLPMDYEDTQLLAKTYMNHTENWKSKTGLKELMGRYYDPRWAEETDYDNPDYFDEDFLRYCAIDGASCYYLYEQLLEYREELL